MDMNEFFYSFISKDERDRISNIEAFDEFEVGTKNDKCLGEILFNVILT